MVLGQVASTIHVLGIVELCLIAFLRMAVILIFINFVGKIRVMSECMFDSCTVLNAATCVS
jgi:hypothetical protein